MTSFDNCLLSEELLVYKFVNFRVKSPIKKYIYIYTWNLTFTKVSLKLEVKEKEIVFVEHFLKTQLHIYIHIPFPDSESYLRPSKNLLYKYEITLYLI